jgi:ubiquinone/menaquinone biosynthesis C-methylase UbiE
LGAGSAQHSYTPALGHKALTPLYDGAIALATRERVWRSLLIKAVALKAGERLLDVGCGTGSLLWALARGTPGALLVGLDPDPDVLARAERRAGAGVSFIRGFLDEAFVSAHAPFDVVVSSLVLHQTPLETKRLMLRHMRKALTTGGRLCIADYGQQSSQLMRLAFRATVQALDGMEDTQPNADGVLPTLMAEAGFANVDLIAKVPTPTGAISVWRAIVD